MKLYIRRNEKDLGPYPIDQLKQLLEEGKLVRNDQASKDKIVWLDLGQFLDAKNNETSISEPPSIEDLCRDSREIVSAKSKPVSESAPEKSESIAPKQKKSSRSSENIVSLFLNWISESLYFFLVCFTDLSSAFKVISNFQENGNKKSKKKLFGVIVFSAVVILLGASGFFLSNINSDTMSFSASKPKLVAVKMVDCEAYRELMVEEMAKALVHGGDVSKVFHALNQKFTTEGMVEISQLEWQQIEKSSDMYGLLKGHYRANQSPYTWSDSEGKDHESWNICFTFDADGANAIKNYLDSK